MIDPNVIAKEARDPKARRRNRLIGGAFVAFLLVTAVVGGYAIRAAQEGEDQAHLTARQQRQDAAQAEADRRAALAAIGQECGEGALPRELRFLCDQVRQIRQRPSADVGEVQEHEVQQPEKQQPERQESERQQPERQQVERQDREIQEREAQDADPNDLETQDEEIQEAEDQEPEEQEAEIQEAEIQNEEVDDPDPNSALEFARDDSCNPPAGEFVTDVGLEWQRSPGTVTLVLTCTSAVVPQPGNQP